jgi:hypothetical protein
MVDIATVRRLALELPHAEDASTEGRLVFTVGGKGFAWTYLARVAARKPRQPQLDVLVIWCPIERKEMLIEAAPDRFFDDNHYHGYPAVLTRLEPIDEDEMRALLQDAWRMRASKKLLGALASGGEGGPA